jgi:cytochrome c peroxidase
MRKLTLLVACSLLVVSVHAGKHRVRIPDALYDADFHDYGDPDPAKVQLGQFLYFDKILSGNNNISCATCHHVLTGTGDGLALPVGEGGRGLGVMRDTGSAADAIHERVPRNAPPVYNLGANAFTVMFHDGRLTVDTTYPSGFQSPAGLDLPAGLDNALAAQAMFPVTSVTEMAGQAGENTVADAAAAGNLAGADGVWEQLAARLRANHEYVELFKAAYPDIGDAADITFVHAANAIGAYEATAFRADNSPFDRYLRGDRRALSLSASRGMRAFYRGNSCASCHSGPLQTDLKFHSIAMPQIGPGKGDGLSGYDDYGRERFTGDPTDRYKFRTPTLRNVALTGPWGHDGAYDSLRAVVEHHLDPVESLYAYDITQARLPARDDLEDIDKTIMEDRATLADIAASNELAPRRLSQRKLNDLMAFLHALTDETSLDLRTKSPSRVPSGLSLAD